MSLPRWHRQLPFPFDRLDGPEPDLDRLIGVVPPLAVSVFLLELTVYAARGAGAAALVALVALPVLAQAGRRLLEVWRHVNAKPGGFVPGAAGVCETCNRIVPVYEDEAHRYVCGVSPEHGLLLADWTEDTNPDWLRSEGVDGLAR